MEKAFFDWPIMLQYDVKAKYRLISRKFSGIKFFHPSIHLANQKSHARLYPFNKPVILLYFLACVCCFCFVCAFSFQGHIKVALKTSCFGMLSLAVKYQSNLKMRLSQKKYQELLEHKDTKLICTGFPEIFLSDFLGLNIKI